MGILSLKNNLSFKLNPFSDGFKKDELKTSELKNDELKTEDKEWTVFLYVNTEDERSVKNLLLNMKMLEMVGSDKNLNIVLQAYLPSWKKVKRFYIQKTDKWDISKITKLILTSIFSTKKLELKNKPIEEMENVNLNDPKVFEESLKWVVKNFPSKKLMVMVIGDNEGIKKTSFLLNLKDFAKGIENAYSETKVKPDILVMDGSSVSSLEGITELKNKASYLVGTSGFASKLNIPFAMFLNEMKNLIDGGPNDVDSILKSYFLIHNLSGASNTTSVLNLSSDLVDQAIKAWDELSIELLKLSDQDLLNKILPLMYKTEDLANTPDRKPYLEVRDAVSFVKLISQSPDLPENLKNVALNAIEKLQAVIYMENNLYNEELDPDSNGLSVFMPFNFGNFKSEQFPIPKDFKKDYGYSELLFSKLTHWDEFLSRISQKDLMEKFLLKIGISQEVIDKIYALKNEVSNLYENKVSGWANLMAWINAVNRINSDKPAGLWFIPPFVTLPLGMIASIDQIYDSLKNSKYVYENIPDKSIMGNFVLDGLQGVSKLVANLAYLLPFLAPVAPAAGVFTFLLPWIKDFYNVYITYKKNKQKFIYNDLSFTDILKVHFLNKISNVGI